MFDEALADVADIKTVGLWLAYRALAVQGAPGQTVAEWMALAEGWAEAARSLDHFGEPSNVRTNVARILPTLIGGRGRGRVRVL